MCSLVGAFIFGYDVKLVVGGMGVLTSSLVVLELLEKMVDDQSVAWSPLRLMGPQPWLPVFNDVSRTIALQIMLFALLFCMAHVLLIQSALKSNHKLGIPFLVIYPCKMAYSLAAYFALYSPMYSSLDQHAMVGDFGADLMILIAVSISLHADCRLRHPRPRTEDREPLLAGPMV